MRLELLHHDIGGNFEKNIGDVKDQESDVFPVAVKIQVSRHAHRERVRNIDSEIE